MRALPPPGLPGPLAPTKVQVWRIREKERASLRLFLWPWRRAGPEDADARHLNLSPCPSWGVNPLITSGRCSLAMVSTCRTPQAQAAPLLLHTPSFQELRAHTPSYTHPIQTFRRPISNTLHPLIYECCVGSQGRAQGGQLGSPPHLLSGGRGWGAPRVSQCGPSLSGRVLGPSSPPHCAPGRADVQGSRWVN